MRTTCLLAALLLASLGFAQVHGQVKPLVVIGCFDGQQYPPEFCPNYSQAVLDLAEKVVGDAYGAEIEVRTIGDWFFLMDALTLPNVIGGVVSLREGLFQLSNMRQNDLVSSFGKGLGLVGINYMGSQSAMGRVAELIFPLNATKTASGKVVRGTYVTSQHTHVKLVDNPITRNSPDTMGIPDSSLIYHYPVSKEGWWTPADGEMTVLYACTTATAEARVPSVILYERGNGRSVALAGLRHNDATGAYQKDLGWFNHSFSLPEVRQLLGDALVYVLEPFASADSLEARMEEGRLFVEERLQSLEAEVQTARDSVRRERNESMVSTMVVVGLSVVAGGVIVYLGFIRN